MSIKKEMFVCDNCGTRTRLKSEARHWCHECKSGAPIELRAVRDKKMAFNPGKQQTDPPPSNEISNMPSTRYREDNILLAFTEVNGPVAQRLEQGTHNPLVPGSNPGGPILHFGFRF